MKKKVWLGALSCLLIIAIGCTAYAVFGSMTRQTHILAYLESRGYSGADIQELHARLSPFNGIAGFGLWSISVEFADEPGVIYYYRYEGGEISQGGAVINGMAINKDILKHAEG